MMDNLYEVWARRNPNFEKKIEQLLLREYTDYGVGVNQLTEAKGKVLGAGYELYIIAFFIGLYEDGKRELLDETKTLGQPIQHWGNIESRGGRKAYPRLREYIFAALVARCDLDLIALEKGELKTRKAVDMLIELMEQYANYGFYQILDKIDNNDPNYFYKHTGFLDLILSLVQLSHKNDVEIEVL